MALLADDGVERMVAELAVADEAEGEELAVVEGEDEVEGGGRGDALRGVGGADAHGQGE